MITSESTIAEVRAQYNDNLGWDGDVVKAKNALAAVRWLLANRPVSGSEQGRNFSFDALAEEKRRLEVFIDSAGGGARKMSIISGRCKLR